MFNCLLNFVTGPVKCNIISISMVNRPNKTFPLNLERIWF